MGWKYWCNWLADRILSWLWLYQLIQLLSTRMALWRFENYLVRIFSRCGETSLFFISLSFTHIRELIVSCRLMHVLFRFVVCCQSLWTFLTTTNGKFFVKLKLVRLNFAMCICGICNYTHKYYNASNKIKSVNLNLLNAIDKSQFWLG